MIIYMDSSDTEHQARILLIMQLLNIKRTHYLLKNEIILRL